jgi:hypothetical protein
MRKARRYQTVEVTCFRTRTKTHKIFEVGKGRLSDLKPVMAGIATREEALARLHELEDAADKS